MLVPIGTAISETYLYLVTEEAPHKQVPEGSEGELWIGGVGVASGYIHAPDLTAQVQSSISRSNEIFVVKHLHSNPFFIL